jgi:hypothetical protein
MADTADTQTEDRRAVPHIRETLHSIVDRVLPDTWERAQAHESIDAEYPQREEPEEADNAPELQVQHYDENGNPLPPPNGDQNV